MKRGRLKQNNAKSSPLAQLVLWQVREIYREPGVLFWIFIFPVLMAWVLGVAFAGKERVIRSVGVEINYLPNGPLKVFLDTAGKSPQFKFLQLDAGEIPRAMKRGKFSLYLREEGKSIQANFDPKNDEALLLYYHLKEKIQASELGAATQDAAGNKIQTGPPLLEKKAILEKGSRYIDFLIPGLIAFGIMNSCMWGIGWSLIQLRMKKFLRRMIATPMKKYEFMASNLIVRFVVSFWEFGVLFAFAYFMFQVEVQGSAADLFLLLLCGNFAFSGISILISSRVSNTQTGNGVMNAVTLPMTVMSGIFFSYHNFPDWLIPIIQYFPLTLLADGVRSIFVENAGLADIMTKCIILVVIGFASIIPGLRIFKWY